MGGHVKPQAVPATAALTLPAKPESVALARRAIAELGERLDFSERKLADIRTVVSEACMNAAVHAYQGGGERGGEQGGAEQFVVSAHALAGGLAVNVCDRGTGIRPHPAIGASSARLGLLLIAALSESVEIRSRPGGGTDLRIWLSADD
jgi:serine/threonine-protein kinase RsbW